MKDLRNKKTFYFSLLLAVILLLAFQNCGDVSVSNLPQIPPAPQNSQILPEGQFCSEVGASYGSQVRFAFILDMSISNLGNAYPDCSVLSLDGHCKWVLGTTHHEQFPNFLIPPSDPTGMRFDVIDGDGQNGTPRGFLLECGNQADFRFTSIGFSTDIMFGSAADTCSSPFKTSQQVRQSINALRFIQNSDNAANGSFLDPSVSPFDMGETYYSKALSCLRQKIELDAALSTDQPTYQVFFMTDGRPTDFLLSPCVGLIAPPGQNHQAYCRSLYPDYFACDSLSGDAKVTCRTNFYTQRIYKPLLEDLRDYTQSVSGSLKFQPIYYGQETGEARQNAINALEGMADAVNNDPAQNTKEITEFSSLAAELCEAYQPQAQVLYQQKQMWAFNLSSIYSQGVQEPDSDLDGIPDKEDANPLNPRSSGGILDKLCLMANPSGVCQKPSQNCEQDFVGLGFNRCDIEISQQIFGTPLTGFDTDNDGLPDFIEIRYGLNPVVADLGDANLDGDSFSNLEELQSGLNPDDNYNLVLSTDLVKWSFNQVTNNTCSQGKNYEFTFEQLPLSDNLAFDGQIGNKSISLNPGENLIALIVIQEGLGRPNLKKKLTVKWIKTTKSEAPEIEPMIFIGDF